MYENYLAHYGVKGMRWGVRKKFRPTSIRAAYAKRQNDKIDKSFNKWQEGAKRRDTAIELGKKRNISRIEYEKNRKDKALKKTYKADEKTYKKALKKNTLYRRGTVREAVGKDMSRKYMSAGKAAKKQGDIKSYNKFMSKHAVERKKARNAQRIGAENSQALASLKRSGTIAMKSLAATTIAIGGVKYAQSKGYNINLDAAVNLATQGLRLYNQFL